MTDRRISRIAIVGPFSSGKSTLANALVGEPLLAMDVLPETATLVRFSWGRKRTARLVRGDGTPEDHSIEEAFAELDRLKEVGELGAVRQVEIRLPLSFLQDVELWDTPGLFSNFQAHENSALHALSEADAVFWVTPVTQAVNNRELQALRRLRTVVARAPRVVVLVNKVDLADDVEEVERLLSNLRKRLDGLATEVFATSARSALDRITGTQESWVGDDRLGLVRATIAEIAASPPPTAEGPAQVLPAHLLRCPGCAAVCERTDKFCACGRDLEDQHRACPICGEDNLVARPRCRSCNLDFAAHDRAQSLEEEALRLLTAGDLAAAAAALRAAVDTCDRLPTRTALSKDMTGRATALQDHLVAARRWIRETDTRWFAETLRAISNLSTDERPFQHPYHGEYVSGRVLARILSSALLPELRAQFDAARDALGEGDFDRAIRLSRILRGLGPQGKAPPAPVRRVWRDALQSIDPHLLGHAEKVDLVAAFAQEVISPPGRPRDDSGLPENPASILRFIEDLGLHPETLLQAPLKSLLTRARDLEAAEEYEYALRVLEYTTALDEAVGTALGEARALAPERIRRRDFRRMQKEFENALSTRELESAWNAVERAGALATGEVETTLVERMNTRLQELIVVTLEESIELLAELADNTPQSEGTPKWIDRGDQATESVRTTLLWIGESRRVAFESRAERAIESFRQARREQLDRLVEAAVSQIRREGSAAADELSLVKAVLQVCPDDSRVREALREKHALKPIQERSSHLPPGWQRYRGPSSGEYYLVDPEKRQYGEGSEAASKALKRVGGPSVCYRVGCDAPAGEGVSHCRAHCPAPRTCPGVGSQTSAKKSAKPAKKRKRKASPKTRCLWVNRDHSRCANERVEGRSYCRSHSAPSSAYNGPTGSARAATQSTPTEASGGGCLISALMFVFGVVGGAMGGWPGAVVGVLVLFMIIGMLQKD